MKHALAGRRSRSSTRRESLELVRLHIDTKTGKIASDGHARTSSTMWFKKGTEPSDRAPEKGHIDPHEVDIMNVQ